MKGFAMVAVAVLASNIVASHVYAESKPIAKVRAITKAEMKELRDGMDEQLKDGPSAIYKDIKIGVDTEGMKHACGRINSKNSYGAYTGFERFVAVGLAYPIFEGHTSASKQAFSMSVWKDHCVVSD